MDLEIKTETPVVGKTKELCQTIVEQSGFPKIFGDIEKFMADEEAQNLYDHVRWKQESLMSRQQSGEKVEEEEIEEFEKQREELMKNQVVNNFFEAQQQMQKVQQTIMEYVGKTFELGRVPDEDDMNSGGCCGGGGGGGGCCG